MKLIRVISTLMILTLCRIASADDPSWSATYDQWKSAMDQADQRIGAINARSNSRFTNSLNEFLAKAEDSKSEITRLTDFLKGRAGDIESAASQARIAKDDYESAKHAADQASQQEEARAQQLQDDMDRSSEQVKQLDDEDDRLSTWSKKLDDWHDRIEADRRPFQLPQEQSALNAFNAEVDQHNAEVAQYNTALAAQKYSIAKYNTWRDQLMATQKLITEDGKHVLDLRDIESQKEQDYSDAQDNLDKLNDKQTEETTRLTNLLGPSLAALQGLLGALDASAKPVTAIFYGGTQYSAHDDDSAAQAVALAPTADDDPAGRLQSRIFVLPLADAASREQSAADVVKRQLTSEMHADDLAAQYKNVLPDDLASANAPKDPGPSAPVEAVADLPIATADISGDSVAYLSERDLSQPLDSRSQITRQEYETALSARARLNDLQPKLRAQIDKLKADCDKTLDYQAEFEEIRAETVRGAVRDLLSLLPVTGILNRLSADPWSAGALTLENIQLVENAMKALRLDETKQQTEAMNVSIESLFDAVAGQLPIGSQDRIQIEDIAKMYKVYSDFTVYVNDPNTGSRPNWDEAREVAKFGVGAAGVFCAPVAVGAGIESLGQRGVTRLIIRSAMQDLSASLKSNVDAGRFLTDEIERSQGFLQELDRTVDGYQAVKCPVHASMSVRGDAL